jgi:hypothetical protein
LPRENWLIIFLGAIKKTGVIPSQAGIHLLQYTNGIPACAGMTGLFILYSVSLIVFLLS